jgi:GNAT superfamily N-acetyltransferase
VPSETTALIRLARADEQRTLEDLQRRASLANPGDRALILAQPGLIELPLAQIEQGQVWVAERGGQALGFAVLLPRDDGQPELDGLFVDPAHWQQGLGRRLVQHVAGIARTCWPQAHTLHVVGNPHATAFYEACGFVLAGQLQLPNGSGALWWHLPLRA